MAVLLAIVLTLATACTSAPAGQEPDPVSGAPDPAAVDYYPDLDNSMSADYTDIDDLFDEYFRQYVSSNPEHITWNRYPEQIIPRQDHRLAPLAYGYSLWQYQLMENTLSRLAEFDDSPLTASQELTRDILRWQLEDVLTRREYMYHPYLFGPMHGPHIDLPMFMQRGHTIHSLTDAENYIARLEQFDTVFAQFMSSAKIQRQESIVPPDFIIDATIETVEEFISVPPEENPLHTTFLFQLEAMEDLDAAARMELSQQVVERVAAVVYPLFADFADYLEQLKGEGISLGIWELPDGREYYRRLTRSVTTTSLSPADIHRMARNTAGSLRAEIAEQMTELGLNQGSVAYALNQIYRNYDLTDPDQLLAEYEKTMEEFYRLLPKLFNILPVAEVVVLPKPPHLEHFPAHYIVPAMDGSRPGVFKADTSSPHSIWDVQITTAHETVPGHHLERALKQELDHAHIVRNTFSFLAYSEGWATYCESLIYEFGPHSSDSMGQFNCLVQQMWRAVIAVIDTGIHYMGWDMSEAENYLLQMIGVNVGINRYVSLPGQSLAYFVGETTMHALRNQAEEALGDAFDIREYHDVILGEGAMPLELLEQRVEEYIQSRLQNQSGFAIPAGTFFSATGLPLIK